MQAVQRKPVFGQDFPSFMNYLRAGDTGLDLSPSRYADLLEMDSQTLAENAGIHRNTIAHAPGSAKLQQFLRESVRVLNAATDLHGNVENALFWYVTIPLQPFGYETASALVSEGRTDAVLAYLASVNAGFAG